MKTTRVFKSGNSLAVRLPKEFHLGVSEVEIYRRGDEIVIREIPQNLGAALKSLGEMPDDFMNNGRIDAPPEEREF